MCPLASPQQDSCSQLLMSCAGIILTTRIWRHTWLGNPLVNLLTRIFAFPWLKSTPEVRSLSMLLESMRPTNCC